MNTTSKSPETPLTVARDITRRRFLAGASGLLMLGPAGCGGAGKSGGGASGSDETRTVRHRYGSTEISGSPERVVTVGFNDQDPALAMGSKPVGVRDWFGALSFSTVLSLPFALDRLAPMLATAMNGDPATEVRS